jgi:stage V sporulation protein K
LNTLRKEDVQSAFIILENRNNHTKVREDKVDKYISEVNNLVGLDDVKILFNKIFASIKVDKLKKERSITSTHKNFNSFFISEHGSGASTIARLYAKSLKESDRLTKGQLVEIDGSTFYGLDNLMPIL